MITIVETIRAVSDLLERMFGAPPTTKDITEGFDRPCTYLQPIGLETAREGDLRHDTIRLQIICFGERTDRGYLALLQQQSLLGAALEDPIPVTEGFALYPENVEFSLRRDEMVLLTEFALQNFQVLPADAAAETMETLHLNRKD